MTGPSESEVTPSSPIPPADKRVTFTACLRHGLESRPARFVLLIIAVCLSLPGQFATPPEMGLDPSWQLALQLAVIKKEVFGRELVFTYGPWGYLLFHAAVNKVVLLLYDLFVLGSLLTLYRAWLSPRPSPADVFLFIAVAWVTKYCLLASSPAVLFTLLCYWLWRIFDRGDVLAVMGAFIGTLVLFLGKVNYGLIMVFLIPAYGTGLLVFQRQRRVQGALLVLGFPALVGLFALICHVNLPGYLRSGVELIAGYNEAMYVSLTLTKKILFQFGNASLLLLAMALIAGCGRGRLTWRQQAMLLPLIGGAALLLFKNAFVRADSVHSLSFFMALPLLLAVWETGWRGARSVRILLWLSLLPPLVSLLPTKTEFFGRPVLPEILPVRYFQEAVAAPWHETADQLRDRLQAHYPESVLPSDMLSSIGDATVDVMPFEISVAVLNGLNYHQRPVPQSYSAYTPWLDHLNARFLASTNAPAFMLYVCAQMITIDDRPAAWDESQTKRALLENYDFVSECNIPLKAGMTQKLKPGKVFLLKHDVHCRQMVPVATNEIRLALGQTLLLPPTTNLVYLTLQVNRSFPGRIMAAAYSPDPLTVTFNYQDGSSASFRAILPILKTGVLVNRRVESKPETRNWLEGKTSRDMAVSSIQFAAPHAWAFAAPFTGKLVEYRLSDKP